MVGLRLWIREIDSLLYPLALLYLIDFGLLKQERVE